MSNIFVDTLEDIVMFSACFMINIGSMVFIATVVSYVYYADGYFTVGIFILGYLFLLLSYLFYIKNINVSRDILLGKLEKKGRKELNLGDDVEALRLFRKESSCQLPAYPANAKEFSVAILFIGKNQLTIYRKCPKSNIYKIEKKKAPGKLKAQEVAACGESDEYYYSYIQSARFDGKKVIITLNSGEKEEIPVAKGPGKKAVNKIRAKLRAVEKNWKEHSRGSHQHYNID
jgi:hypothetical protein